jgi:ATP synthase protein I
MKKPGKFSDQIDKSARDLMKAKEEKKSFLHYAQVLGVGGWLFVIPMVGGAYLGRYLDRKFESDISWTLTLTFAGMALGIYNVWYFFIRKPEK